MLKLSKETQGRNKWMKCYVIAVSVNIAKLTVQAMMITRQRTTIAQYVTAVDV